jgi:hypothetical protein
VTAARVLLMRLSCRTSARGVDYLSGYLGAARVVAFKAKEPDKYGNPQWEIYVAEPEPKDGSRRDLPTRGQSTCDAVRDLPADQTEVHRNERHDPRQQRIDERPAEFDRRGPDQEPGF